MVFAGRTARYALEWGVGLSLALHALLLSVHFVMPDPDKLMRRDKGLEVVLVNARHAQRPDTADVLAQTNLDAGGNTEQRNPVRPLRCRPEQTRAGDSLVEAQRRTAEPQAQQVQAMTAKQGRPPLPSIPDRPRQAGARAASGYDLLDSSAAVARIEAQIDKDLMDYASRPRKKFIGAAPTNTASPSMPKTGVRKSSRSAPSTTPKPPAAR